MRVKVFILLLAITTGLVQSVAQEVAVKPETAENDSLAADLPVPDVESVHQIEKRIPILPSSYLFGVGAIAHNAAPLPMSFYNSGRLSTWDGGAAYGIGSADGLPGLGNFRSASVGIVQQFGRFAVNGTLSGYKYHLNRTLYNDFGISGYVSYQLNPHFAVNVFGNYSTNNVFDSPAAMPYVNFSCFGGSVRYSTGETFGVELGVRRVFDPLLNRWQTVPVVAPTVKIGDCAIGVDVGGFIKSLIDSNNNRRPPLPEHGNHNGQDPYKSSKNGYGSIPGSGPHLLPAKAIQPR